MNQIQKNFSEFLTWFWPAFFVAIVPFLYFFDELFASLALELSVFSFLLIFVFSKPEKISPKSLAAAFLSFTYLYLAARSVVTSADPSVSLPTAVKLFAIFASGLIFFAYSRKNGFIHKTLYVSVTASLLHTYICIAEYIEAPPIPSTWIDPGMKDLIRTRCAGIFTDPNIFGAFLTVLFFLNLGAIVNFSSNKYRFWSSIAAIGTGVSLLMTLSRGSWAGAGAGLFVFLIASLKSEKVRASWKPLGIVFLILAAIFLIGPFKYRFASMTNMSDMTISQRSLINKAFIKSYSKIPITGFGLHTFNQIYPRFRIVGGDYPMNAHNELLHSFLETGPLSALILFFLTLMTFTAVPGQVTPENRVTKAIFSAIFTSLVVHNLTGFSSKILPVAVFLPISAAIIFGLFENQSKRHLNIAKLQNKMKLPASILLLLGIFIAYNIYQNQIAILNANTLFAAGKLQQALQIAKSNQPPIYQSPLQELLISEIQQKLGDTEKARVAISKAIELNPSEAQYYILKAERFPSQSFSQKCSLYEKAIKLDPASEIFRLKFAQFLAKNGEIEKALTQLKTGLSFSPGYHKVYTNYLQLEDFQKKLIEQKK